MRRPRKPDIGAEVRIRWLDSGADNTRGLVFNTTYGVVEAIEKDERIHLEFCSRKSCHCYVLKLNMELSDDKDVDRHVGRIWWSSVVEVKVFE